MVKDTEENQVIPVEDVLGKDSINDESSDDGAFHLLEFFPFYWKLFMFS